MQAVPMHIEERVRLAKECLTRASQGGVQGGWGHVWGTVVVHESEGVLPRRDHNRNQNMVPLIVNHLETE